ncbi:hypothetical protein [Tenacibaculum jejuense]|uniref:Uncharacterized protein n=1 Tax=Tenacibaculum jejuense TaxID=584609 RepID=A0A238UEX8_9FLAO|nr:hypothetical protein [Tenacibaculum jejuense]SNR16960.1 membrane protein of unknown function [Tenacibaculum jejuense]
MSLMSILFVIILITISWSFYRLAKKYDKNRLVYTLVGVIAFMGFVFINALLYTFLSVISDNINIETHRLLTFLIGVLISIVLHFILEKTWLKGKNVEAEEAINEIGEN